MHTVLISVLATLGVLAVLRLARALVFRHHFRHGRDFMARRLLRRIDATPEQERAFREELDALRGALHALRSELFDSRAGLARALEADALDAEAAAALFAPALRRLEEARAQAAASLARLHAALAPAQRRQLAALLQRPHHLHRHRCAHC
jgi:Spy/CpxP family protein refolding chaperone